MVWHLPTTEKVIYLTFDDGPVPGATEFVLENLSKFNAKATFFCIGDNVRKHPNVFQKIIEAGHAIGNHTFNHLKGWRTPLAEYVKNVTQCQEQLAIDNQSSTNLFRPPYGRITRAQIDALQQYKIIMWDVLSYDYRKWGSVANQLRGTINATRSGSIVVFHDSYKAEPKMQYMLPRYLHHFANLGYAFQTIPQ